MTIRNLVGSIDTTINWLKSAIDDSRAYVDAEILDHDRKFPKDRGSPFVRNLFTRVVSDQDAYMSKLISNLLYMKQAITQKKPDAMQIVLGNIPNAVISLQRILEKTERGMGMTPWGLDLRYHQIENAIATYGGIKTFAEEQLREQSSPSVKIPPTYSGWEPIGTNATPGGAMWKKDQGNYSMLVQESYGKYYATVKDIKNYHVYSIATPFNTPMEAMNAATSRIVQLASESTAQMRAESPFETYKPKYVNRQGKLY